MLIDILLDDKTVVFYPIPKIYMSSHSLLIRMGVYEIFDFHYIKKHARFYYMSCKKKEKVYLECKTMEEFFVPNFAFLVFCKTQNYYLAYQLVNWSVVDCFVFRIGFEVFCEYDLYEDIAEYCLKKYILEKICADEKSYENGYLWLYFNKKLNFYNYLSHVHDFINYKLKYKINNHNWRKAKWFYDLIPIHIFDFDNHMYVAGISYRDPIRNYILNFDLKAYEKRISAFRARRNLDNSDEEVEFERTL